MQKHSDPEVVLFADDSSQSAWAREVLNRINVDFREVPSLGYNVPVVEIGGVPYWGPDGLSQVVQRLRPKAITRIFG